MTLYPRSFLQLILSGYVVVLAPLLAAIAYVMLSLDTLSDHYQTATARFAAGGRLSWELPDNLEHMENSLRQYESEGRPALLVDYVNARLAWQRNCLEYQQVAGNAPDIVRRVQAMLAREREAYGRFQAGGAAARPLRETVEALQADVHQLLEQGNRVIQGASGRFQEEEEGLRRRLWFAVALAVALAGGLLVAGQRNLVRMLGRFEREVVRLGKGQLERPVRLTGTADMQWLGRRLDWLRRRLLRLEGERTRLLRHASHELKTPLAALREGSSLLTEGAAGTLNEGQSRIASIMHNNALRLDSLIDGLLRLQQANHAGERIRFARLRIDEMIQQVLATHQLAARDKHLCISGSLAPAAVEGGQEELLTVLNNLISNAIKYSPDGGRIRVDLFEVGSYAVLDVADEGPGVGKDEAEKIFEPFYRCAHSRQVAGVGLGLAIAREYVHAHGGHLGLVETTSGAHFRATFPLAEKVS